MPNRSTSAVVVFLVVATLTAPAAAETLTPGEVLKQTIAKNPQMTELRLTIDEAKLDAKAQESLRPLSLRSDLGAQFDEQPSAGVIESGVRQTRTYRGSAELLKQFVYGTSVSFRIDVNRTVAEIPFTVPDLNISETRTIGPNWFASATLTASQPILRGFGKRVNNLPLELAQQQVDVAELQRLQAANELVAEALNAYWRWIGANLDLAAREQSVERTKVLSEATLAQIEAGQLAELERDIVEQRIAAAEQTLIAAEAAVIDAAETLRKVMGMRMVVDGSFVAPQQLPPDPPAIPSLDATLEAAERANPELALLQEQVDATRLSLVRSKDQIRPQLDAVATVAQLGLSEDIGEAFEQVATIDFTSWFVGLTFAVPFDNGLAKNTLEADRVAVTAAETRHEQVRREIELTVRQARRLLETQKRRLELSEREITLARKNLVAMQAKFEAGLASYLEVLQLEEDLSEAELRYNQSRIDVITARIGLQRLAGTLPNTWGVELSDE